MTALSTLTGPIDATASAGRHDGVTTAKELNDRFLRLLIAQMNNQDPLNPLDNAQVTSQMAQINTVTGINGLNDTVAKLIEQFARLESMQAAQLTGRAVLVQGATLSLPDDGAAIGGIELAFPAERVTVQIRDAAGQIVRELELGPRDAGVSRFDWDGKTANGAQAAAGDYTFSVTARAGNQDIGATALAARRVEGVRHEGGVLQLVLAGGAAVAYGDVRLIL